MEKRKLLLCVTVLLGVLLISCTKDKIKKEPVDMELEGMMAMYYYFSDSGILIANQDRLMYSDWEEIQFDYICTDPLCTHMEGTSCTAISSSKDNNVFTVEYDGKLILFEKYYVQEQEKVNEKEYKTTTQYYIDIYEAKLDGSNRQHKLTMEGSTMSEVMNAGVIVAGGYAWFGGTKSDCIISEIDKEYTYSGTNALFAIDLDDFEVKEYAVESDVAHEDYSMKFVVGSEYVYASKNSVAEKTTSVYRIDVTNDTCELLFKEDKYCYIIGELGNRFYYYDNENHIYYRDLSNPDEMKIFEGMGDEGCNIAAIVGDKFAVVTKFVEQDGAYEIEYTFFDAEGNEIERHTYNEHFVFWGEYGDRIVYVKPFAEQQMWWTDTDDLGAILENGTYIGTFIGAEHDTLN